MRLTVHPDYHFPEIFPREKNETHFTGLATGNAANKSSWHWSSLRIIKIHKVEISNWNASKQHRVQYF